MQLPLSGDQLKTIRQGLGLSVRDMARALGFEGVNSALALRRYERGEKPIPPKIARLAIMFSRFGIPPDLA
jgi:transcriptional regulator with XRE-family HTH domain